MKRSILFILAAALSLTGATQADPATDARPPRAATTATDSVVHRASQFRLDDITIEGEVDIPRVLFIESREHLRDQDFLHHLFLSPAAEVGAPPAPRRILHWSPQGEHKPWTP